MSVDIENSVQPTDNHQQTLLIVDDIPANVSVLFDFLTKEGYRVLVAKNGQGAIQKAEYALPDLILLDVMMPGMDGFEACRILKHQESTRDIPIIFMTALSDVVDKVRGFNLGAADYVTKPFQHEEILARVRNHLTFRKLQKQLQARTFELEKSNLENERARQMAEGANRAKSVFLANMSHELRTPLNAIIGYSDLLREEAVDMGYGDILSDLDKIQTAAKHLLGVISDVLDIAKIEAEKMEVKLNEVDIMGLVQDVLTVINPSLGTNVLNLKYAPDIGFMLTDSLKLQQILFNLLNNAAKFTQHGTISLRIARTSSQVIFEVADTGIGISADKLPHIFKPFTQADDSATRRYGGTGLGLAISSHYCKMMRGKIEVASEMGKGSTFIVQIPDMSLVNT